VRRSRSTRPALTGKQKRALRSQAHHLKPVVFVGAAGLTDAVLAELEVALADHEMVKVRIAAPDRTERRRLAETLTRAAHAHLVQTIGHIAVVYREREDS